MLRELGVLGFLVCGALWAAGLPDAGHSRLGDRPSAERGTANGDEDKLIGPPKQWSAKCEEIITRFEASMSNMSVDKRDLKQAIGQTAKQAVMLRDFEDALNAANCPVNARELNQATQQMSANGGPNAPGDLRL